MNVVMGLIDKRSGCKVGWVEVNPETDEIVAGEYIGNGEIGRELIRQDKYLKLLEEM